MTKIDWENITNYIESVGTTDTNFPFAKAQSSVKVTNGGGPANLIYTIGGQSGTLTPSQSVTVTGSISSMTLRASVGRQSFQVWATEANTEQDYTDTDFTTQLAQKASQSDMSDLITVNLRNYPRQGAETDDTARLQRAIDAIKALGKGRLLLPDGNLNITTVTISSPIEIVGQGDTSTITSTSNTIIVISNCDHVSLKSFKIIGTTSNTSQRGLDIQGTLDKYKIQHVTFLNVGWTTICSNGGTITNGLISDCRFFSCGDASIGVWVNAFNYNVIRNNWFDGLRGVQYPPHSIYLHGNCNGNQVTGNTITNGLTGMSNAFAIKLATETALSPLGVCSENVVSDNYIYNCDCGIWCVESQNNIISNNIIEKTVIQGGIELFGNVIGDIIEGNIIRNSQTSGINVIPNGSVIPSRCIISNNKITRYKTTGVNAIFSQTLINNNQIDAEADNSNYAITIQNNASDVTISNNLIVGAKHYIYLRNTSTNIVISGNKFLTGVGGSGNYISATETPSNITLSNNDFINAQGFFINISNIKNFTEMGNNYPANNGYSNFSGILVNSNKVQFKSTQPTDQGVTWNKGDVVFNSNPVASGSMGWVVTGGGTTGTLTGVTGSINSGSATLTVNDASQLQVNQWLTIAGVTGYHIITAISGTTVTITPTAGASVTNAAVSFFAPTFKTWGTISA